MVIGRSMSKASSTVAASPAPPGPSDCFVHKDRPGKPSLVLDLIEEFRQPVVDRTVFGMLNRGMKLAVEDGRLTDASRRMLAQRVAERLEAEEPYQGKRHKLRTIIQLQARRIAAHVRGDASYSPWIARW